MKSRDLTDRLVRSWLFYFNSKNSQNLKVDQLFAECDQSD